jgi:hypothetical protein
MSLPDELAAIRDEAMRTSCEGWAIQNRWTLSPGRDRSGPCPKCGGSDRFSVNTVKDVFNCRHCGISGQGVIKLVMLVEDLEFVAACELITGRAAKAPVDPKKWAEDRAAAEAKKKEAAHIATLEREKARQAGYMIWQSGWKLSPGGMVDTYLKRRALDFSSHPAIRSLHDLQLREYDRLQYMHPFKDELENTVYRTLHTGPVMLAAITMRNGRFGAVHQTWIDLDQPKGKLLLPMQPGDKKLPPAKKMRGTKQGGAIQLYTPEKPRRIVMGEGIETTLTALCHAYEPETAYWAGADLPHMSGKAAYGKDGKRIEAEPDMADEDCFIAPTWCEELVFLGEADEPGKHQEAKCQRGLLRSWNRRQEDKWHDHYHGNVKDLTTIYVPPAGIVRETSDA